MKRRIAAVLLLAVAAALPASGAAVRSRPQGLYRVNATSTLSYQGHVEYLSGSRNVIAYKSYATTYPDNGSIIVEFDRNLRPSVPQRINFSIEMEREDLNTWGEGRGTARLQRTRAGRLKFNGHYEVTATGGDYEGGVEVGRFVGRSR